MPPSLFRSSLLLTALLAGVGCHGSSDEAPFLLPGASNLGIEAGQALLVDGAVVAWVPEWEGDLNGDGDAFDVVIEILALADGRRTRVPFATTHLVAAGGGFVSYPVPEAEANADLNGDGDREDLVLHVVDVRDGTTRNLGLVVAFEPGGFQLTQSGALLALGVSERGQGTDLDGDGDLDSSEAFVYEAGSRRLTALGRGLAGTPVVSGRRVAFVSGESTEGDLNGDGDLLDRVAWLYDADTGQIRDLGRSVERVQLDGSTLALESCECAIDELEPEGSPDLNGNGLAGDVFVEMYDLESGVSRILEGDTRVWGIGGDLALLRVERPGGGPHLSVYDRFTDALFELGEVGLVPPLQAFANRHVAFWIDELGAGRDLDGDGLLLDTVLHSFDARTGRLRSARRPTFSPAQIDGDWAAFLSLPGPTTVRPPASTAVLLQDLRSGAILDPGLPANDFRFGNGHLVVATPEAWQGTDLNGDGDVLDQVLQVHDLATGVTSSTRLALYSTDVPTVFHLEGDVLLFSVSEADQGLDLDGDQDLDDLSLHVLRLR